ncbi:MAG: cupin domain-containing protein [Planctomycetota bacterium]|nr:cupin domain-containing protein [Planctomycetota bacterium]
MRRGNLYQDLPPAGEDESFEPLLNCEAFRLERIVSTGHSSPSDEWFDQTQDEWVVLLQGEAQLLLESEFDPIILRPGDWIHIPAHQRHRVVKTQKEPRTVWLALHHEPHLDGLKLDTRAQGH